MLKIGDKVRHKHRPDVGVGEIVEMMSNDTCTVLFNKCKFTAISFESIGFVEDIERELCINSEKLKKEKIKYEEKFLTPRQNEIKRFNRHKLEIEEILNWYNANGDLEDTALKIANIFRYNNIYISTLLEHIPVKIRLQPPIFTNLSQEHQRETQFLGHQLEIEEILNWYNANGDLENTAQKIASILDEYDRDYSNKNTKILLEDVPTEIRLQPPILRVYQTANFSTNSRVKI